MNTSTRIQSQLLATKFYIPVAPGTLISRPRLSALLDKGLNHPLTLISAPAGFGKTTLLSTWAHALQARDLRLCWASLDEEDNEPRLFWTYVLTALDVQGSHRFEPLLMRLQSQPPPPLKSLLTTLVNLLAESEDRFVLILDDYQLITEEQVHMTLAYLVEHLPAQLHIILSTRADPPLPLPLLRSRQQALEVRMDQLRCTAEEVKAFFREVVGIQMPEEAIQQVTLRTEGWLVGLHLLGLSLRQSANPATLLQEVSGEQCYILDYLTEVVLGQQPQEVQTFLLSTCMLERLTASLCDAVTQRADSQQMLQRLEQANVFVVSLDSKRQWYRYHALFAEALSCQFEKTQPDLVPILHHRASLWYAQHNQATEAILHAFKAKEWQWAADLIEGIPLMSLTSWGASEYKLTMLQDWLEQLPVDIMGSRPRLCLACTLVLWAITPPSRLRAWFDTAQATLMASLTPQTQEDTSPTLLTSQARQEQENLLGEVIAHHATLCSYQEDGHSALLLCQQALALLSADNFVFRAEVANAQIWASYHSSANDAVAAIQSGLQGGSLAQTAGQPTQALATMGNTAMHMLGTGQLHEALQLTQQARKLATTPEELMLPDVGWSLAFQAAIRCEWNQLDAALSLAEEALELIQQISSISLFAYLLTGHAVLLHIFLSRRDYSAVRLALRAVECISLRMNQPASLFFCSFFATVDQVRFWLVSGELDRATRWAEDLDLVERHANPLTREREEVACARILLAKQQPDLALQRLDPVLQRATIGKRWGHVIEIRLLQALAYQMLNQETQALDALSEVVHLAEPEGYIRSFVDEGIPMQALLSQLREQQHKTGPTPYLDRILAAFEQETVVQRCTEVHTTVQALPEPLSEREREVLQLLARGASNQEIAQELVIVVDTVKRHVSHIFSKLGVNNRVQAIRQARERGLLDEES